MDQTFKTSKTKNRGHYFLSIFCFILFITFGLHLKAENAPVVSTGVITNATPGTTNISVKVSSFNNIGKFTLTMKFDTLRAHYISATPNPCLAGMTITYYPPIGNTQGKLIINWTGTFNYSLPDNSELFNLNFTYVTGTALLRWAYTSGSVCQFRQWIGSSLSTMNDSPRYLYYQNGGISNRTAPVTYVPTISNSAPGVLSIPIKVNGFSNIGALTLNLEYDPTLISYTNSFSKNSAFNSSFLVGNQTGSNGKMLITMQWYGSAMNLPDSSTICTLSFTCLSAENSTIPLNWYDIGGSCEYASSAGDVLLDMPANVFYINGEILLGNQYNLSGTLSYDNALSTPMNTTPLFLKSGGDTLQTTTTATDGAFQFTGLNTGIYNLAANCTQSWGGVNATDALHILLHFTQMSLLDGIRLAAADVDGSGYVNAVDGLLIANRFVNFSTSFPVGDWVIKPDTIIISGTGNVNVACKALVFGDVNGSFNPNIRQTPAVSLISEGEIQFISAKELILPVFSMQTSTVGAISMILNIPEGIKGISKITTGKNSPETDNLLYNYHNNKLYISWYSTDPMVLNSGDPVFHISMETEANFNSGELIFSLDENSSVADQHAEELDGMIFRIPKVVLNRENFSIQQNSPNPCNNSTSFTYTLPENARVNLHIINNIGNCIFSESREGQAGLNSWLIQTADYSPGVYHYILEVQGGLSSYIGKNKLVIVK